MPRDPELPVLFGRADALAAGMSRHQISNRVRRGVWLALRRNVYCLAEPYAALTRRDRHLLAAVATLRTRSDDEVVSHLSAAAVLGLPLPLDEPSAVVTLTSGNLDAPTRRSGRLVLQVASLSEADRMLATVSTAGRRWPLRITVPARTVADNLRHLAAPDAVALGDGALRRGVVSHEGLVAALERQSAWPYAQRGRTALMLLDPRRETWLESHSFTVLHLLGLPMPEPQVNLFTAEGRLVGRVDGWIDDRAVALEADGHEKYFLPDGDRLSRDADVAADQLKTLLARRMDAERRRETAIRDLRVEVVRWGMNEVRRDPHAVLRRIADAQRRGDRARFLGRAAYQPAPPWLNGRVGIAG